MPEIAPSFEDAILEGKRKLYVVANVAGVGGDEALDDEQVQQLPIRILDPIADQERRELERVGDDDDYVRTQHRVAL